MPEEAADAREAALREASMQALAPRTRHDTSSSSSSSSAAGSPARRRARSRERPSEGGRFNDTVVVRGRVVGGEAAPSTRREGQPMPNRGGLRRDRRRALDRGAGPRPGHCTGAGGSAQAPLPARGRSPRRHARLGPGPGHRRAHRHGRRGAAEPAAARGGWVGGAGELEHSRAAFGLTLGFRGRWPQTPGLGRQSVPPR